MQRILIVRLSAIGDVIMASGIVPALRSRYPNAHIAWLAEPAAQQMLKETDGIDQIIVWPRQKWQQLWKEKKLKQLWQAVQQFKAQLRSQNFDVAIDIQGLLKSSFLAWLSGAKQRFGFISKEKSHWLLTDSIDKPNNDPRISSEYRQMARYLGAEDDVHFRMTIGVKGATMGEARYKLLQSGVNGPYGLMLPFTTRAQKHWFDEHWQEFAALFAAKYDMPLVMLGGPGDIEHATKLAESSSNIVNMVGKTSLCETAAIIQHGRMAVGVDTGLTHLCIAKLTPVVALFGSTRPYIDTGWAGASVLYHNLDCSPCRRHPTCGGAFDCLKDITAQEVMAELEQVCEHRHVN